MRTLSAGICGTDYAHHRHFTDYAEGWRKSLVAQLNADFSKNAGAQGWDYRATKDLWKNAPPFDYRSPGLSDTMAHHAGSLIALLIWLLASAGLAGWSVRRMRVV